MGMHERDWYRDSVRRKREEERRRASSSAMWRGGKASKNVHTKRKEPVTLKQAFIMFCWVIAGILALIKWYPSAKPLTAPNGEPWPQHAAYLTGYPVLNNEGGSRIGIDNTSGASAVHGQLVDVLTEPRTIVRQFYVPGGKTFEMHNISPGAYKLRFMEISSGNAWEVENIYTVGVERRGNHYQHTGFTLHLNRMRNSNSVERKKVSSAVFRGN